MKRRRANIKKITDLTELPLVRLPPIDEDSEQAELPEVLVAIQQLSCSSAVGCTIETKGNRATTL